MAATLPPIPRVVFTILEPISCFAGFYGAVFDTTDFVSSSVPDELTGPSSLSSESSMLALQLGNMYGLIGMIGLGVLYATSEPRVVRNYLIACAIGDVGHLFSTYVGMGYSRFVDWKSWNALACGNIGYTLFLLIARVMYLLGYLGQDQAPVKITNVDKKTK